MRAVWDPDEQYSLYSFVRQAQTFPDVLLCDSKPERDIILGIELKGWYLLAKEGEPSLRFRVNEGACAPADLIAVVPWCLSMVISGSPRVYPPYVEQAKYVAGYRNYWWAHIRETSSDTTIISAPEASPYPAKSDRIEDKAKADSGNNYGRVSRTGLMDSFNERSLAAPICGIEAKHWRAFFSLFREQASSGEISNKLEQMRKRIEESAEGPVAAHAKQVLNSLEGILNSGT